ncbi:AraC family transcriptional regulator [Gaoshiqia sp. Z1-71]|uniref:AraC family transcriptional regulator n=1 Tax=Gaoshiqia hydrogeniformans TaxID=3290090 RepID=UPI003BF91C76
MNDDFLKYLTPGERDKDWGIYLNVAGSSLVLPKSIYPSPKHPTGYHFNWQQGRILNEYQINYITDGKGILENEYGRFQIKPGSVMITAPGVWHRYKPLKSTGWKERYIGFNGQIADQFLSHSLFSSRQPVIHIGIREEILDTYLKIFSLVNDEKPGFQQVASGMVVKLLGYLLSVEMQKEFTGKRIVNIIEEARFKMRAEIDRQIDLEQIARDHHIGYSYFRKMFKSYTGIAPHQYHLELKIMRSKELLLSTDKSIKEISFELGFQSIHYFSRIFKNKVGINPSEFRS